MRGLDYFLDRVAGALAGRRIYAWLWLQVVGWSMLLFAFTGSEATPRRVRGMIAMAVIGTIIFTALVIRAVLTGVLAEYLFARSPDMKRPNMEMRIWIRYVIPLLCIGSWLSRPFFAWFLG